jgi:hypothetical protein
VNLPLRLSLQQTQTQWSALLNPVLVNILLNGHLIKAHLINGVTVVNHGLGSNMNGWIISDQDGAAQIYRSQPLNDKTLTLTSNAAVNVALWVF